MRFSANRSRSPEQSLFNVESLWLASRLSKLDTTNPPSSEADELLSSEPASGDFSAVLADSSSSDRCSSLPNFKKYISFVKTNIPNYM